jgi:hypothetical protein
MGRSIDIIAHTLRLSLAVVGVSPKPTVAVVAYAAQASSMAF